jgi:transketolase
MAPKLEQWMQELPYWERTADLVDQCIDIMLNHRQSGHPGGSRSKVHLTVASFLGGAMRWDVRDPSLRFADRFVLVAGHCTPVIYGMLAVLHEAMWMRYERTGDKRFAIKGGRERSLLHVDLLDLRRHHGLPGHAEMEGKTLVFKANTGPSGHGMPPAVGQALALKHAGAGEVKVFAFEGEGGHTAGAHHESKNSAWGLGLSNLLVCLDWNNFGIDDNAVGSVVHGTPDDWYKPYGWKVVGCEDGSDFQKLAPALHEAVYGANPGNVPVCFWMKTRKGRGYGVYDNKSHGTPHKPNSEAFWETKRLFAEKYGVQFTGFGQPKPESSADFREQSARNLEEAFSILRNDPQFLDWLTDKLVANGEAVPKKLASFKWDATKNPAQDRRITDWRNYPAELYAKPGAKQPNRAGFALFGAYANAISREVAGRPLFLVCAADLAESTNIAGFAKDFGASKGFGWYQRGAKEEGCLLPQQITEFTNSGIVCGIATTNFSERPEEEYVGYYGGCSTYGSFSYLKYGPMRLFSQIAQDSQIKVGQVIWVAGHSGPETAEDSRTHFGIFAPGVTQLFPKGHVANLHPWEHNEVAPALGAALAAGFPIIALHLTRPAVEIPDRAKLGMPSYLEAGRGAYVMRPFRGGRPPMGTLIVQGTSTTESVVKILPELEKRGLNVKIVQACSRELFDLQDQKYKDEVLPFHEWMDSTVITNGGRALMHAWLSGPVAEEFAISSDWDDRWRTGGSVEEITAEAHIDAEWVLKGIERFVAERKARLERLRGALTRLS